jgi:uncharacterized protein YdeI (YjbR/CyaY-like superfamily)
MAKHTDGNEIFHATDSKSWRSWLRANHKTAKGVWLIFFKAGSEKKGVNYAEAVEEALCYGWIDSRKKKLDEARSMQFFSKRNPKSYWSSLNKERVAKLIARKKMTKPGMEMIDLAKESGTWDALTEVDRITIPDDLNKYLDQNPTAREHFNAFPPSSKKIILSWILNARTPETRSKRIKETVDLAFKNIRANQYSPPKRT